jgi:propanediol dehydratase small subunit
MTERLLTAEDYPIAEKRPELVEGARGKKLEDITLASVVAGKITMEDLRIMPGALLQQAAIARAVGRDALAANFERASEMTRLPQPTIMEVYELLRPGRSPSKQALLDQARRLREDFAAERLAAFLEEAAEIYERRRLFSARY